MYTIHLCISYMNSGFEKKGTQQENNENNNKTGQRELIVSPKCASYSQYRTMNVHCAFVGFPCVCV